MKEQFPIEVSVPPAIARLRGGRTFIVSGGTWIPVPTGTTREEIPKWMVCAAPAPSFESVKVTGSRGDIYTVTRNNNTGKVSCVCRGFKWHRYCRHQNLAFGG